MISYKYDEKGRLIEKKTPDAAPVYIGYDPLNRPVLTQDGKLRLQNKWYYTKFDIQGRLVMEGIYQNTTYTIREDIQKEVLDKLNYLSDNSLHYEEKQAGTTHRYSNQSFPTTNTTILKVNYYDDYDFNADGSNDYGYTNQGLPGEIGPLVDQNNLLRTHGLPTGGKSLVLSTSNWLINYLFYDKQGNVIQVRSNNHLSLNADNLATSVYRFDGALVTSKQYQKVAPGKETALINKLELDRWGRIRKIFQNINNAPSDQLVD